MCTTRLMTMIPLHPCGKPCSTGTPYETVKTWPYLMHSIRRIMIEKLPLHCSTVTPRKENAIKTTLSRHLIDETWYKSKEGNSLYR